MLMVGLGGASEDAETARIKAQAFSVALSDVPTWAVKHAVARWLRGEVSDVLPGVDVSWSPKPPQIRAVAMAAYAKARGEYDRLQKLSVAEVEPRPATKRKNIPPAALAAPDRLSTPELQSMLDAIRPAVKPMSGAERALIERMRAGVEPTPEMIEAVERAHE